VAILEKIVFYQGQPVKLYSLDGVVWSSRKSELKELQKRLNQKRLEILGFKTKDNLKKEEAENQSSKLTQEVLTVANKTKKVKEITKNIVEIKAQEIAARLKKSRLKADSYKPQVKIVSCRLKKGLPKRKKRKSVGK
jgi:Na+/phosphate symporter